jgi:hypothetical protein
MFNLYPHTTMSSSHNTNVYSIEDLTELNLIDVSKVIPDLEQTVEIQRIHLSVNPNDREVKERMKNIRLLLSFLHFRKLGL